MLNQTNTKIEKIKLTHPDKLIGVLPCGITIHEGNKERRNAQDAANALYHFCMAAERNIDLFAVIDWDWEIAMESKLDGLSVVEMTNYLDTLTDKVGITANIFKSFKALGLSPNFYWIDMTIKELKTMDIEAHKFMWSKLG